MLSPFPGFCCKQLEEYQQLPIQPLFFLTASLLTKYELTFGICFNYRLSKEYVHNQTNCQSTDYVWLSRCRICVMNILFCRDVNSNLCRSRLSLQARWSLKIIVLSFGAGVSIIVKSIHLKVFLTRSLSVAFSFALSKSTATTSKSNFVKNQSFFWSTRINQILHDNDLCTSWEVSPHAKGWKINSKWFFISEKRFSAQSCDFFTAAKRPHTSGWTDGPYAEGCFCQNRRRRHGSWRLRVEGHLECGFSERFVRDCLLCLERFRIIFTNKYAWNLWCI